MARPWRIEFSGACYHVINRGNYRRELFTGAGAAEAFERVLGEAATRFGWRIHGLAAAMMHSCSISNSWLAQRLVLGQPASASQFARRWLLHPAGHDRTNTLLSRVKT